MQGASATEGDGDGRRAYFPSNNMYDVTLLSLRLKAQEKTIGCVIQTKTSTKTTSPTGWRTDCICLFLQGLLHQVLLSACRCSPIPKSRYERTHRGVRWVRWVLWVPTIVLGYSTIKPSALR